LLAERLGRHFNDTDEMLEDWEGLPIAQVFTAYGEPYFRDVETRVVAEVAGRGNKVIATGGGAVLRTVNVAALRRSGLVVWLRAEPDVLRVRLAGRTGNRPSLTGADPLDEIAVVAAERAEQYAAAADTVIDTDALDPAGVADAVQAWLATTSLPADYDPAEG
ncbi:MAG: shikimate kinase, partial [Planctomycetota bacterium]